MTNDGARSPDNDASPKEQSLVRGVVAAAVSAVAMVLLVSLILGEALTRSAFGMTFFAVVVFLWAIAVAVLIGLPIHFALRRLRRNSVGPYLAAGVVGSLTPAVVEAVSLRLEGTHAIGPFSVRAVIADSMFLMPCGLVAGAVFWAVCVRGKRLA
jgi:hypothetical protein